MKSQNNGIKDETKILIMLAFFSISMGLWNNFRQLWLESNNIIIIILAISWSILISTSYENKTDGIYINRVDTKHQLFYSDMRFVVGIFGESLGLLFAGFVFQYGVRYILGLSSLFIIPQILLAYKLINMRNKEKLR